MCRRRAPLTRPAQLDPALLTLHTKEHGDNHLKRSLLLSIVGPATAVNSRKADHRLNGTINDVDGSPLTLQLAHHRNFGRTLTSA